MEVSNRRLCCCKGLTPACGRAGLAATAVQMGALAWVPSIPASFAVIALGALGNVAFPAISAIKSSLVPETEQARRRSPPWALCMGTALHKCWISWHHSGRCDPASQGERCGQARRVGYVARGPCACLTSAIVGLHSVAVAGEAPRRWQLRDVQRMTRCMGLAGHDPGRAVWRQSARAGHWAARVCRAVLRVHALRLADALFPRCAPHSNSRRLAHDAVWERYVIN